MATGRALCTKTLLAAGGRRNLQSRMEELEKGVGDSPQPAVALLLAEVRKRLAGAFRKRYDQHTGYAFYENTRTEQVQWERPVLFARLYPGIDF